MHVDIAQTRRWQSANGERRAYLVLAPAAQRPHILVRQEGGLHDRVVHLLAVAQQPGVGRRQHAARLGHSSPRQP